MICQNISHSKGEQFITIKDNTLFLKGEKKTFNEETKEDYHHIERTYGSFHRAVPLAKDADAEKVKADFKNGLLTIEIGKKRSRC